MVFVAPETEARRIFLILCKEHVHAGVMCYQERGESVDTFLSVGSRTGIVADL